MSAISEAARLSLILADYASQDSEGKIGLLGAGWIHTSTPTPAQAVAAFIEVPGEYTNTQFAFELVLEDQHGHPHRVPNPLGGEGQPLRVGQNLIAMALPGAPRTAPSVVPFVVGLAPGMTLTPDSTYTWRLTIDGDRVRSMCSSFYVRPNQPGPVIG